MAPALHAQRTLALSVGTIDRRGRSKGRFCRAFVLEIDLCKAVDPTHHQLGGVTAGLHSRNVKKGGAQGRTPRALS